MNLDETTCPNPDYEGSSPPSMPPLPGKKGAAFTLRDEGRPGSLAENMPKVIALNPSWSYSWDSRRRNEQPDDIEFVPMVWGAWGKPGLQRALEENVMPEFRRGTVKRLLAFNEPDNDQQSNLDVSSVLDYWPILEATNIPLVSPAAQHGKGRWMRDFMERVDSDKDDDDGGDKPKHPRMDWVAIHWYGGANAQSFKDDMRQLYRMYGGKRPLLITEFAPADWKAKTPGDNKFSEAQVLDFMKDVLPWLEAPEQDWIVGYAWFSFQRTDAEGTSSALFDEDGQITACGRYYASVTTDIPSGDQSITV